MNAPRATAAVPRLMWIRVCQLTRADSGPKIMLPKMAPAREDVARIPKARPKPLPSKASEASEVIMGHIDDAAHICSTQPHMKRG